VVQETDHALAIEPSLGITRAGALAMAALLLHQHRAGFPEAFKG
jgi:hypothetical protein